MPVFLTGATGLIGSALVPELIHAGHYVLGLTRSESENRSLLAVGAQVPWGTRLTLTLTPCKLSAWAACSELRGGGETTGALMSSVIGRSGDGKPSPVLTIEGRSEPASEPPKAAMACVARLYRLAWRSVSRLATMRSPRKASRCGTLPPLSGRGPQGSDALHAARRSTAHFGRIGCHVGFDLSASSVITQQRLGWLPTGPGLLQDLSTI